MRVALPLLPVDAMVATPSSPKPPETLLAAPRAAQLERGLRRAAVAALLAACALSVAGCPGGGADPDTKMPVNSPVPSVDPPKEETPATPPSPVEDGGAP